MKFSYTNNPILKAMLKNNLADNIKLYDSDKLFFQYSEFKELYFTSWLVNLDSFKSNINVISTTFVNSAEKAQEKIIDLLKDIIENDLGDFQVQGTFIMGEMIYQISYHKVSDVIKPFINLFVFNKNGYAIAFLSSELEHNKSWVTGAYDEILKKEYNDEHITLIKQFVSAILTIEVFKKFAEVDTKIIQAKSKERGNKCVYDNQTDFSISFFDSKWFTNIVRSQGFKVSGHFRLQPYKNGEKKIIWIEEFKKNGYTSKAKIINQ